MKHNYYFKLFLIAIALFVSQSVWAQWSGNGSQANPYKINNTEDWNTLCDKVYQGNDYSNKNFELTNDITVSRCIGAIHHYFLPYEHKGSHTETLYFKGNFNGAGHTITLTNLHSLDNIDKDKNKYLAPFRFVKDNVTIENLHVTGTINASDKYAGGIVGNGEDCNIKSCRSSVNIISSVNGDGSHGGLVGYAKDDVTITDCLFDGSLVGPNTKCWGGFTGWAKSDLSITRCLFNPTGVNVKDNGNKTFYRSDSSRPASGHYYKQVLGTAQGTNASGMTNEDLRSALGGNWEIIDEEVTSGEVVIYRVVPILHTSVAPSGTGTENDPYIIASDGNWNYISNQVNGGNTYSGKFLALTSDINVNTMIGEDESKSFRGTFDGRGHTITFSYTSKNHKCGPFRIINGATIKNLHTTGTIYTSKKNAAGLVGKSFGSCTIERCRSSVTIHSSVDGDGTDGGFIGEIEDGNVTITNCLFDGKIIGTKTEKCGGFIGWVDDDAKATIENSLFNPAELTTDPDGHKTFARAEQGEDLTLTNCYYKATFGDAQGTDGRSKTTDQLVTALGSTYWQNVADAALPKMNFQVTQFTGSGTEENPYIIASTANWNYLMERVNSSNSYSGKFFRLDADIDISTMVGCTLDEKNPGASGNTYFSGSFDGNGHTLNLNLVGTGSDWVAPFLALENATIENLNLTGTVTTNRMRPASITSFVQGTVNIENCSSSVNIISNYNSDIDAGAFVARVNTQQTLNMTGCVFTGKIIYSDSKGFEGGGLVGFTQHQANANLKDCLFAPSEFTVTKFVTTGDVQYYHYMLVGGFGNKNFDNCYYNSVAASLIEKGLQVQGNRGRSIIPNRFTTVENAGAATVYNISGLTSYGTNHGILYADTLRAGNADVLSLTLGYTGGDKYHHNGFSASHGTLSGSSNPFSLTMADNNCIITANISFNTFKNDGNWNVASNWSLGVVPTDCDVAITNAAIIPNGCTAIVDSIDMQSKASIIISDGGQLIANNAITAQVQKTIESSTYQGTNKWYLIASPVSGQTFAGVTGLTSGTHNIYRYDEPTNTWQEYRNPNNQFSSFENGRGYLFRTTNSGSITFNGTLNNAPIRYNLSYTEGAGDLKGFNIIGNPFSHNIYKGSAEGNAIANDYLEEKYCVLNTDGTWTITEDYVAIAPGQGILVQAKPEAGSLDITNSMVGPIGKKADNDNIWFTVKNSEFMDKACVEFRDGHGFNKPTHYNADAPMFYVRYDDEDFASVCMPDDTKVIDLRFESKNMSQYTLTVNANGDFSYLHLIDKVANKDIDMLIDDSYTFVGSSTDDKDRFEVVLRYNADPASTPTETFAYQSGNDIIVSGEGELQVFDVMGRMISTRRVTGVETIEKPSQTGVYIFKLNEKTQKIVIR